MTGGKRGGSPKLRPAMTGSVTYEGDRLAPHLPRNPGQETGLGFKPERNGGSNDRTP